MKKINLKLILTIFVFTFSILDFFGQASTKTISNEGKVIYLPAVPKGETASITLHFPAQDDPGIYNSYWELIDNDGAVILDNIFVAVQVRD